MTMDEGKLNQLVETAVRDFGATFHAPLVVIGDRLGLYKTLAQQGPMTTDELAASTETHERYVREWASSQAAGGYIDYDPATQKFSMSEEQVAVLADEDSPVFVAGAFQSAVGTVGATRKIIDRFRSGDGLGWHEHDEWLFHGTERLFRPNYVNNLVQNWIPALEGVEERLMAGARVADIGCGHGASTVLMAKAYPKSQFFGFDYHDGSIEICRERAKAAGVDDRITFEVAKAKDYPGSDYDLVATFDCLHDMGDPAGAAAYIRGTLKSDGAWMIVEPFANDQLEDNMNPVSRAFYSVSTLCCTPASRSQEVGRGLGAQAGEARLREEVVDKGGFSRLRRATETPFNLVLEARP